MPIKQSWHGVIIAANCAFYILWSMWQFHKGQTNGGEVALFIVFGLHSTATATDTEQLVAYPVVSRVQSSTPRPCSQS
jgi:hypothetical protein